MKNIQRNLVFFLISLNQAKFGSGSKFKLGSATMTLTLMILQEITIMFLGSVNDNVFRQCCRDGDAIFWLEPALAPHQIGTYSNKIAQLLNNEYRYPYNGWLLSTNLEAVDPVQASFQPIVEPYLGRYQYIQLNTITITRIYNVIRYCQPNKDIVDSRL